MIKHCFGSNDILESWIAHDHHFVREPGRLSKMLFLSVHVCVTTGNMLMCRRFHDHPWGVFGRGGVRNGMVGGLAGGPAVGAHDRQHVSQQQVGIRRVGWGGGNMKCKISGTGRGV